MSNRTIGLLGESPGPLRRWSRILAIAIVAGAIFACGVAVMAVASA